MFENYIFAIYSASPYFCVYKIEDDTAIAITTNMTAYETFDTTYDWQEVQIINDNASNFVIGVVLGKILRNPVIISASMVDNVFVINKAEYGVCDYIVSSFALYKNSFCDSMIGFVTNNYNSTSENYRIEQRYIDGSYEVTNEIPAYYLCNQTISLEGKSRAVIAKTTMAPYIWIYYYPQVYRYSISLTDGVQNWISTNLMYIIQKYNDTQTPYKIYSLNDYNNPEEFVNGFPAEIDASTITDFEFVGDTLIIFTTQKTYAINLKETHMVVENLPQANANYTVEYQTERLIGSLNTEGIMGSFSVEFNI